MPRLLLEVVALLQVLAQMTCVGEANNMPPRLAQLVLMARGVLLPGIMVMMALRMQNDVAS
jgi:hypothetical protein